MLDFFLRAGQRAGLRIDAKSGVGRVPEGNLRRNIDVGPTLSSDLHRLPCLDCIEHSSELGDHVRCPPRRYKRDSAKLRNSRLNT